MVDEEPRYTETWGRVVLEGDAATRKAGASARAKADEIASTLSPLRRFAGRIGLTRTDEYSWRRGQLGEEEVAKRLEGLGPEWITVSDIPIGTRGANVDHLVVGPGGVFTLNTKNLKGKVSVWARTVKVNGYRTDFLPKATREAQRVAAVLARHAGWPVKVRPVLVIMGATLDIRALPYDVDVVARRQVRSWFKKRPPQLTKEEVAELEKIIRRPSTWSHGDPRVGSLLRGSAPA